MKLLIVTAAFLALCAPAAFADEAHNSATIGAQVNEQNGVLNSARNDATILQSGYAASFYIPYAVATNSATVGAQVNTQNGVLNSAANSAWIEQSSGASPFYGVAGTANTATIGAQVNTQNGLLNEASNSATVIQSSDAGSLLPVLLPVD